MQFVENNENANEDSENFIESDINHEKNNETCIACKSTIDPTCATNTTFGSFEECPLLGNDRCYHMIKDGKHKRGECFDFKMKVNRIKLKLIFS